ncbi:MAG: hypothetical protein K8T89_16520 [Planctomycetes bacterium]|nr:hypothetical protein [Planctomycetota bacterium]
MTPTILRDPEQARFYLLQGLWLQRAVFPNTTTLSTVLRWALFIADAGMPVPPTGFIADVGHTALGKDRGQRKSVTIPGWPPGLERSYEDHVLGKLCADGSFLRACDALKRIEADKQPLGLAYLIKQYRERGEFGGVEMSPGVIRGLIDRVNSPEELLHRGWESLQQSGPMPLLIEHYEQIVAATRRLPEVLALEDVIALEQQTALLSIGEYVAHRQVLQMAARIEEGLPRDRVKPLGGRREVASRIFDEDTYPVGGFASISTRGSIESLLHSQLAYMESDRSLRPDLFDVKYLRDELYYYSRDENQFLRRRRAFLFVLAPDLIGARFKDADLPCQRLVLVLAMLSAGVRKLTEWLGDDALRFEFLFLHQGPEKPLAEEAKLLGLLFRERIENQTVGVEHITSERLTERLREHQGRSLCHCLALSVKGVTVNVNEVEITSLKIDSARPTLGAEDSIDDEPFETWVRTLTDLLRIWV